jgi:c-di-GMP phosphodiesterase
VSLLIKNKLNKSTDEESSQIFLARQPIFDRDLNVVAYELLYRNAAIATANIEDATYATAKLITNTFLEIGFEDISGGKLVFINLPRPFITGEMPIPLDPARVVLEVLEDVCADDASIQGVKALVASGYSIALDDFVQTDANRNFIPLANIIKIDVLNVPEAVLREQVAGFASCNVKLLAEKVETDEQYLLCKSMGFELFQGYFFCKPKILESRQLPSSQLNLLAIIAQLQDPECRMQDIEKIFNNDIGMSFKLFKIINSSFYNLGKKIESIHHALILLGLENLKKWIVLISFSSSNASSRELLVSALVRAKMSETMAANLGFKAEVAFTVGMFSLLDAFMEQPLELIVNSLPLSEEVRSALLKHRGDQGQLLAAVIQYEKGDWDVIDKKFLHKGKMFQAYRDALSWCANVAAELDRI